jgi:hypothetical protein
VRLGILKAYDFEEGRVQMDIPAQNIFSHEEYDSITILNDIALIKLPLAIVLPKKKTDNCEYFLVDILMRPEMAKAHIEYAFWLTLELIVVFLPGFCLVNINAIRLPKRSEVKQSQEGKMAITSGWGRINPGSQIHKYHLI